MPTEVQRMPSDQRPYEKLPLSNSSHPNPQWVHKEALRVAIGSILAPKRPPFNPGSRSTSGTASPYSFPSSQSHSGSGTPTTLSAATPFGGAPSGEYLHPHHSLLQVHSHHHHYQHPHTPSKLVHSHSPDNAASPVSEQAMKLPSEPVLSLQTQSENDSLPTSPSTALSPIEHQAPGRQTARPALSPLQASNGRAATMPEVQTFSVGEKGAVSPGSGNRTPKSKYVEKLQSKSAWDALIHGSFS